MPSQVIEYKCLLISPTDVNDERDALTELVGRWNAQVGSGLNARVNLVRWESHSVPDIATRPQDALNTQLVRECDLGIAVFWWKMGTKTENHPSGSAEEIYELLQKGSRVLVYFSDRPIPQDALKDDQYSRLQELKKQFLEQGLYAQYSDLPDLREKVNLHLTNLITQMLAKDRGGDPFVPSSGTVTAPTPDVRVQANPHFIKGSNPGGTVTTVLGVSVENHSPSTVYLGNISFEMKDGQVLTPQRDPVTGEFNGRRKLESGDSFTMFVDPHKLREHADDIVCARATDAIGRVYRSNQEFFAPTLQLILRHLDS